MSEQYQETSRRPTKPHRREPDHLGHAEIIKQMMETHAGGVPEPTQAQRRLFDQYGSIGSRR